MSESELPYPDEEIARLEAENERLRAALGGGERWAVMTQYLVPIPPDWTPDYRWVEVSKVVRVSPES